MQNHVLKVVTISLLALKIPDALLDKSAKISNSGCANDNDSAVKLGIPEPHRLVPLKHFRYFTSVLYSI